MNDPNRPNAPKQLGLQIVPKLVYEARTFVLHQGVNDVVSNLLALLSRPHYPLISVIGPSRSGKTHLAIYLADRLRDTNLLLWSGRELAQEMVATDLSSRRTVVLVDDADLALEDCRGGNSALLVKLVEDLRVHGGSAILFREKEIDEHSFDPHLNSRFRAGTEFHLTPPDRSETSTLLSRLAAQRGIRLTERKLRFLERRVAVTIADLESYLERVELLARLRDDGLSYSLLDDAL